MGPPAPRPRRGPGEDLQGCGRAQEVDLEASRARRRRLGARALGNGSELKGPKRALTVHGLPHRIQIRRRRRRRRGPGAATTRHGGGRGRRGQGLTRKWSAFLSAGRSRRAAPAPAGGPAPAPVAGERPGGFEFGASLLGAERGAWSCHSNLLRRLDAIGWFADSGATRLAGRPPAPCLVGL